MAIANRLPGTFAFAAAVAACLLCGAAATFSRGDLLMIAGSHIPLGGSTTNATYLVAYTPSGDFRGSIDISTPAPYPYKTTPEHRKAYNNLTFHGLTLSADGKYAFLIVNYDEVGVDFEPLILVANIHAPSKSVTYRHTDFFGGCTLYSGIAVAPGSAPATYTLYVSPECGRKGLDSFGIFVYIYNTDHSTLRYDRMIPFGGGRSMTGRKLERYPQLFTIGTSLYAVGVDIIRPPSGLPNPLELYNVNTVSGAVKTQLSVPLAADGTCFPGAAPPMTLNGPTSLYGVCQAHNGSRPEVTLLSRGGGARVVPLPFDGHDPAGVATLPGSPYLYVMSQPHVRQAGVLRPTITTLRKDTGKVYKHSFSEANINTYYGEMVVVP